MRLTRLSFPVLSISSPSIEFSLMWTVTENTEWEREECAFRRVVAVCLLVLPRSRIEYTSFLLCTVSSSRPLITTEPLGHRRWEQGGEREIRERYWEGNGRRKDRKVQTNIQCVIQLQVLWSALPLWRQI